MGFLNWWKDKRNEILHATLFGRSKMTRELEILDGEVQSRYEKIHGEAGLCSALTEIFNVMAELRLKAEYGDYLAYTCQALKSPDMQDMIWKVEKLDWQEVVARIRAEEADKDDRERRRLSSPLTPYLNDIAKAANRLVCDESLVRYQVLAYADRNNFCHSGIKAMAHSGDFIALGERILEDLRSLEVIYRNRPTERIDMQRVIKLVEKEWFVRLWFDTTSKPRRMKYALTDKGTANILDLAPASS